MTNNSEFKIAVLQYPDCSLAAVYGLNEMFWLANANCRIQKLNKLFLVTILKSEDILSEQNEEMSLFDLIILPPSIEGRNYMKPDNKIKA